MWLLYIPLLLLGAYGVYQRLLHPLAALPGPFLASLSPLWLVWQCMHRRRPRLDLELHRKYGPVVRIAPNEVLFSSPAAFAAVYGAGTAFRKSRFYEAPTDSSQAPGWDKLDMLAETDVEKLRVQKRLAGPIYATANARRHERLIDNNIRRWIERLRGLTGRPLDFYAELEMLNVDVMCEVTFAQPFGAVAAGSDGGHMHTMDAMWSYFGWVGYLPWLNAIDKKYSPWRDIIVGRPRPSLPVFAFCMGKIAEYQQAADQGQATKPCLHDDMRNLTKTKPDFRYNWGTMLSMTDLGAGVDTLSWTLATVLAGICSDRQVYAHVRAELASATAAGHLPRGQPVPYDAADAVHLPYLDACLHEAQRLWPNVAISLPRIVPAGGFVLDGFAIPAGTVVGMNSRQLGRDPAVFGPEAPDAFRPRRWLDAAPARRRDMLTRNLAFGGPSRRCPGMHLAWVVMVKVLASVLLEFDFEVLNELDGPPGPGKGAWREWGSFPTKWSGWEVEITEIGRG